jgi:SAM-dependent methyltransferase
LKITKDGESGDLLKQFDYVSGWNFFTKYILPVTRWLRAINAEKYMQPRQRHLDIGCGDGFFLRRSKCEERFGLDELMGDAVSDHLDFRDNHFDFVTMLAVIEHLRKPEGLVKDVFRVLKPGGRLILTTPKESAEWFIKLYAPSIGDEHETYFDLDRIKKMADGYFNIVGYHDFIFGLNQVFCLEKKK